MEDPTLSLSSCLSATWAEFSVSLLSDNKGAILASYLSHILQVSELC